MFIEKIELLTKEKNISIAQMLKDLNMGQGTFSTWKTRGTIPKGTTLQKIADYFSVTVDYLLNEETEKKASPSKEGEDVVIVSRNGDRFVHHLNPDQMNLIENMIAQFDKNKK